MTLIGDLWIALPKEVKFIFAIAVFLYAGSTILQAMVLFWNVLFIGPANLINGCLSDAALCIPAQAGILIFGINFADYWTITVLMIFPTIIVFALKWYSMTLNLKAGQ